MRYLSPILNTYPKIFKSTLDKTKFNLYVCDVAYYKATKKEFQQYLFLQFNYNENLIKVCRDIRYYVDEYPVNMEDKYMIVLSIPEEFKLSYDNFCTGNYSKMYSRQQLETIGIRQILQGKLNTTRLILTGDKLAYDEYCEVLRVVYKTNEFPSVEDVKEFDIPPRINQETLNYKNNIEWVKQNTPLKIYLSVE